MSQTESGLTSKVEQPIPALPHWTVIALVFAYTGFTHEVQNLLRQLSKNTRAYSRSKHMILLKNELKIHRLWAPNHSTPQYLTPKDVIATERNGKLRNTDCTRVMNAWNNIDNLDLAMVAQQITNSHKQTFYRNDPKKTTWTLIIPSKDYNFDPLIPKKCQYNEYRLPGDLLCILAYRWQNDEDHTIQVTNQVREKLLGQNGWCAEQNIQIHHIYAPASNPTRPLKAKGKSGYDPFSQET